MKSTTFAIDDDFADTDLQEALALSLQQGHHEESSSGGAQNNVASMTNPWARDPSTAIPSSITTANTLPLKAAAVTTVPPSASTAVSNETLMPPSWQPPCSMVVNATAEPFDGIVAFHGVMWDDAVTTLADKERWLSQGIDVREDGASSSSKTAATEANPDQLPRDESTASTAMDGSTEPPLLWGLVQKHGGPCGVLAAVQAELLRILFFGESPPETRVTDASLDDLATRLARVCPLVIRTALARSMALILVRAALTPSASPTTAETPLGDESVDAAPVAVRIVLPNAKKNNEAYDAPLQWQDLAPWLSGDEGVGTVSSSLTVYTIPISDASEESCSDNEGTGSTYQTTSTEGSPSTATTAPKRQKMQGEGNSGMNAPDAVLSPLTDRIRRASRLVEAFLLDETRGGTITALDTSASPSAATANNGRRISGSEPLDSFRRQGGVLLLVLSLTATRSFLQHEFDDPVGSRLVAQFGHTGQELINLLLTGQAVSNAFDNNLSISGDMVCRGVQSRPVIGYLSQLEALRYCEVGGYYKSPQFPIWVVGSTSHFTVLFGDLAALKESKSDMLLDECRRAFKAVEGGEENGFIKTDQLGSVLKSLNIKLGESATGNLDDADETASQQTLAASLEVGGAAIILWDDFWKAVSRLLTGASLEVVLQGNGDASSPMIIDGPHDGIAAPPPLLTNYAANPEMHVKPTAKPPEAASLPNYVESDEEMARRLEAEWGNDGAAGLSALSNAASLASSMEIEPASNAVMSDEEMARKLQEQFDSEGPSTIGIGSAGSLDGLHGSSVPGLSDTDDNSSTAVRATPTQVTFNVDLDESNMKMAPQTGAMQNAQTFERFGDSFALYHYNGLRGGVLTPFRVTRLTAEEAVGTSIALNRGAGVNGLGGGSQDLEDVVRTKWPSCVIDWFGRQPPYID